MKKLALTAIFGIFATGSVFAAGTTCQPKGDEKIVSGGTASDQKAPVDAKNLRKDGK